MVVVLLSEMSTSNSHTETITISMKEYNELVSLNAKLLADVAYYKQELEQIKRMIFGSKSERYVTGDNGQLKLDFGTEAPTQSQETDAEKTTYERRKNNNAGNKQVPVRSVLPANLPRKEETIEPDYDTTGLKKIGEEVTEVLEYEAGRIYVRRIVRPKYARPNGEGVIIAGLPSLPIPKGNASASLLAYIIISKYVDHLPFYRQRQMFKRLDIDIPETTINGWFKSSCDLLELLYEKLIEKLLQSDYLQADETPIPVLTSEKKGSTHKGYHWVYHSPLLKLVGFSYQKGRGMEGPGDFLRDFRGTLQTDGYVAYDQFEKNLEIILLSCMAHIRRYFEKALSNDPRAEYAMMKIQELYAIERKSREAGFSFEQRKVLRQEESFPVMQELKAWLKNRLAEILPKSAFGTAVTYALNMWPRMERYLEDGRYAIDNNLIENTIRPVALGRKNYLFAGSHEAAQRAAMMYSFLGTCKINDVNPQLWLNDVIGRIPDHKANRLEELLPNNWKAARENTTGHISP